MLGPARRERMAVMLIIGGLLAAFAAGYLLTPAGRAERAMATSVPSPSPSPSSPPRASALSLAPSAASNGALSPAAVASCRKTLTDAMRDRVVRARPSPNRIEVDEQLWAALAPNVRDGLMQALACDAWRMAAPPGRERAVAYGWTSRRRLAALGGIGRGQGLPDE